MTVSVLLSRLSGQGQPRLTWYGEDERVELSGHVLDNWVTKTTHLLVDELDVRPGRHVLVDLPAHWRAIVWALAALRVGATLGPAPGCVVVTDTARRWPDTMDLAVVALPALARRAVDVPPGAIDANAAVMTYPDRAGAWPAVPADAVAFGEVRHGDLVEWARRTTPLPARARVLAAGDDPVDLLAVTLSALAGDGSAVLAAPQWASGLLADPARRARLVATERIDLDLLPPDPESPA